ncbi:MULTISPECIES: hypothetical protein [Streptomyces]|uniref:hypothetical protein n=1 Tax=Streptomyces TaxID=1883 RepID=UPI001679D650|nr:MULTISPECIES: hypothetical protein [Streptomyces]MBD3580593.1 hypothetical protein [Streptomyces sp. KD18]GGT15511.1 hypothetical protein GCM10010286_46520 [Streptomyces toxytricini]
MNNDDEYSATVLGSHWIDGPPELRDAVPDRVEGSVLRFGPGVTAAAPAPFPVVLPPRPRRRPEWRRYTLAGAVLLGVLGYLLWQEFGPGLAVREVSAATADGRDPGCDSTADVVALVRTNGRPGTITYRWLRSDGTRTEALTERVPRGRDEARLHLLWTFRGEGVLEASATVEILSPDTRTARTAFTYRCER